MRYGGYYICEADTVGGICSNARWVILKIALDILDYLEINSRLIGNLFLTVQKFNLDC